MSKSIPPGNRLRRDKALLGTDKGQHGPVKIILKDGKPPETGKQWLCAAEKLNSLPCRSTALYSPDDDEVIELTRQQEKDEQDFTQGCPFDYNEA